MLVARNQPLRLDSLSSWESSGGADADRTRDLLNAIHFTSAAHTKPAQQIPRNTAIPRFFLGPFWCWLRGVFGQSSDNSRTVKRLGRTELRELSHGCEPLCGSAS